MPPTQNAPPAAAAPAAEPAKRERPEIGVAELRFNDPRGVEVPLPSAHRDTMSRVHGIRSGVHSSGREIEIVYLPWMRHHRVTLAAAPKGRPKVFFVPETWVTWEPAEPN